MLTYNEKTFVSKTISECGKGEHSITSMKCAVIKKMNMDLKHNFS